MSQLRWCHREGKWIFYRRKSRRRTGIKCPITAKASSPIPLPIPLPDPKWVATPGPPEFGGNPNYLTFSGDKRLQLCVNSHRTPSCSGSRFDRASSVWLRDSLGKSQLNPCEALKRCEDVLSNLLKPGWTFPVRCEMIDCFSKKQDNFFLFTLWLTWHINKDFWVCIVVWRSKSLDKHLLQPCCPIIGWFVILVSVQKHLLLISENCYVPLQLQLPRHGWRYGGFGSSFACRCFTLVVIMVACDSSGMYSTTIFSSRQHLTIFSSLDLEIFHSRLFTTAPKTSNHLCHLLAAVPFPSLLVTYITIHGEPVLHSRYHQATYFHSDCFPSTKNHCKEVWDSCQNCTLHCCKHPWSWWCVSQTLRIGWPRELSWDDITVSHLSFLCLFVD